MQNQYKQTYCKVTCHLYSAAFFHWLQTIQYFSNTEYDIQGHL